MAHLWVPARDISPPEPPPSSPPARRRRPRCVIIILLSPPRRAAARLESAAPARPKPWPPALACNAAGNQRGHPQESHRGGGGAGPPVGAGRAMEAGGGLGWGAPAAEAGAVTAGGGGGGAGAPGGAPGAAGAPWGVLPGGPAHISSTGLVAAGGDYGLSASHPCDEDSYGVISAGNYVEGEILEQRECLPGLMVNDSKDAAVPSFLIPEQGLAGVSGAGATHARERQTSAFIGRPGSAVLALPLEFAVRATPNEVLPYGECSSIPPWPQSRSLKKRAKMYSRGAGTSASRPASAPSTGPCLPSKEYVLERERGFKLSACPGQIPDYDSLNDRALFTHFDSRRNLRNLVKSGKLSLSGRSANEERYYEKPSSISEIVRQMDDLYTWKGKDVRILKAKIGGKVLEEKEVSLRHKRLKAIYGGGDVAAPLSSSTVEAPMTPRAAMSSLVEGLSSTASL